ncbi:hypothetical protein [Desulfobacter latus]|uniref:Uncharacterized protein n=1 Tax=Desulfobacter latus TaxID=2292 RepID=A0A850T1B1_9BACT|nr:hypothetical protein [Desulfobacter latus]NWH06130.1 hypothetical protein [Desulfobacter latus]
MRKARCLSCEDCGPFLFSGGSGTIGKALVSFLKTCGHDVIRLLRAPDDRLCIPGWIWPWVMCWAGLHQKILMEQCK